MNSSRIADHHRVVSAVPSHAGFLSGDGHIHEDRRHVVERNGV
ncbi:MAG: hypothetical protein ABSA22_02345 [Acidimicrobiales bacterium]